MFDNSSGLSTISSGSKIIGMFMFFSAEFIPMRASATGFPLKSEGRFN